ncbi:hypothetical protein CTEN210_14358 [Chaetoceros tenuissimus]|uniref:Ionotropic glutamate receptor C-terminal domain-containing protein n=2 Tax=Chaetoceros tenuissimus TaxID=426638 RepID=A0AAD3D4S1_9STRA|nr:hypothetical protein CTEN210_14358 [Chaetoceros tenuissimus]
MICLFVEGSASHRGINAPFKSSMISVSFSYIHQVFLNATGHLDISPHTHAGQMVSFSMSFFAMLLFASYTANLASFLVIEKTNMAVQVNTVNDIVQLGKSMCIWGTTAGEEIIRKTFPGATLVDHFRNDEEVLLGVKEGQCDYAIVSLASYNLFRGMEAVNDDCNLVRIGRTFRSIRAGFATQSDAGTFCTSLVRDMLHAHLRNLQAEGFIDDAWDEHYSQSYDINDEKCFAASVSTTKESSNTLNITNLGGMFLFHGILLVVSFGIYFLERSLRKKGGNTGRDQIVPSKLQHKSTPDCEYLTQRVDAISEKQDKMAKQIVALTKMFEASVKGSEGFHNDPQFSKSVPQDYTYDLSGRDGKNMD